MSITVDICPKAVARVKEPFAIPTACRYCQGKVDFVGHEEVYAGRRFGDWPYAYLCRGCGAYVGVHPQTDIPLGTLADAALRKARKENKPYFLELCDLEFQSRSEAYTWLAEALKMPVARCHWGWFDVEICEQAGKICADALKALKRLGPGHLRTPSAIAQAFLAATQKAGR